MFSLILCILYLAYKPCTSQRGGPHSVWIPPPCEVLASPCEVPGIYVGYRIYPLIKPFCFHWHFFFYIFFFWNFVWKYFPTWTWRACNNFLMLLLELFSSSEPQMVISWEVPMVQYTWDLRGNWFCPFLYQCILCTFMHERYQWSNIPKRQGLLLIFQEEAVGFVIVKLT